MIWIADEGSAGYAAFVWRDGWLYIGSFAVAADADRAARRALGVPMETMI
jgi:hypothetical protein